MRSLSAGNDPLYVVDGVPIAGGIGDFNPEDIESLTVLKGPEAAALYGIDAASIEKAVIEELAAKRAARRA